jgi:hypothetical protein
MAVLRKFRARLAVACLFLSTSPVTYTRDWLPTPRWAAHVLAVYALAAVIGGLLYVICAALTRFTSDMMSAANLWSFEAEGTDGDDDLLGSAIHTKGLG